jgi:predicted house-cleaning noncanonical NTP pyrophosphatase (MazG superfamily)
MTGHEGVIEGRPTLNINWDAEYAKQRKNRMTDAIDEYLQDEKTDARQSYEEILDSINSVVEYHKKNLKKAEELRDLMLGYRHVDFNDIPDRY